MDGPESEAKQNAAAYSKHSAVDTQCQVTESSVNPAQPGPLYNVSKR
jgi:hypothetical protein